MRMKLLLCVTGSVACIKVFDLCELLCQSIPSLQVRIAATERSLHFFDSQDDRLKNCQVFSDKDEWSMWNSRGDPVMHIELRNWADLILVAPLDANSLAKVANGLCDNLVTCIIRACTKKHRVFFCPAMNTGMYESPLTQQHLDVLENVLGFVQIPVISKTLMCGEKGTGAMAEVATIVEVISKFISADEKSSEGLMCND